jgi:uncharacterized protein (TIGR03086 family)
VDLRDLDRQAMKLASEVVAHVRPAQLRLPTPCADWTLHGLLRHLISENVAFAAATTAGIEPSDVDWNSGRIGSDPVADYEHGATAYLDAFVPDSVLQRPMRIGPFGVVPGATAVAMHFVDTVAHAWDVAKTIDAHYAPDEEMAGTALQVMRRFPSDRPTAAFDVQVPTTEHASELDKFLAYVGRDPQWSRA